MRQFKCYANFRCKLSNIRGWANRRKSIPPSRQVLRAFRHFFCGRMPLQKATRLTKLYVITKVSLQPSGARVWGERIDGGDFPSFAARFLRLHQLRILFARKFEEMEPVLYANRFLWLVEILGALLRVGYWFWWNGRLQELVLLKTAIFSFEIFRQHNDTTFDDHERRFFFMEIGNNEVW